MATEKERAAALRKRRLGEGLTQVAVWVPAGDAAASVVEVAAHMRADHGLRAAAVSSLTGRRVSMKAPPAKRTAAE